VNQLYNYYYLAVAVVGAVDMLKTCLKVIKTKFCMVDNSIKSMYKTFKLINLINNKIFKSGV
jgi:hypothetical protein